VSLVLLRGRVVLSVEMSVRFVPVLFDTGRPLRLDSATEVASSLVALPLPFLEDRESGWMLSNFNVWIGMSATPIIIEVAVPMMALAPPERGSMGPSSMKYSEHSAWSEFA
jgi:hypothetical protein